MCFFYLEIISEKAIVMVDNSNFFSTIVTSSDGANVFSTSERSQTLKKRSRSSPVLLADLGKKKRIGDVNADDVGKGGGKRVGQKNLFEDDDDEEEPPAGFFSPSPVSSDRRSSLFQKEERGTSPVSTKVVFDTTTGETKVVKKTQNYMNEADLVNENGEPFEKDDLMTSASLDKFYEEDRLARRQLGDDENANFFNRAQSSKAVPPYPVAEEEGDFEDQYTRDLKSTKADIINSIADAREHLETDARETSERLLTRIPFQAEQQFDKVLVLHKDALEELKGVGIMVEREASSMESTVRAAFNRVTDEVEDMRKEVRSSQSEQERRDEARTSQLEKFQRLVEEKFHFVVEQLETITKKLSSSGKAKGRDPPGIDNRGLGTWGKDYTEVAKEPSLPVPPKKGGNRNSAQVNPQSNDSSLRVPAVPKEKTEQKKILVFGQGSADDVTSTDLRPPASNPEKPVQVTTKTASGLDKADPFWVRQCRQSSGYDDSEELTNAGKRSVPSSVSLNNNSVKEMKVEAVEKSEEGDSGGDVIMKVASSSESDKIDTVGDEVSKSTQFGV